MAVVIVVVVLLAVSAGVAFALKGRKSNRAGTGPNEILQSPPSSFPTGASKGPEPSVTPVPAGTALPAPQTWAAQAPAAPAGADVAVDEEPVVDRFRAPGSRVIASTETVTTAPVAPRYPLEPTVVAASTESPTVEAEPVATAAVEPEPVHDEPEPALTAVPVEPEPVHDEPEPEPALAAVPASTEPVHDEPEPAPVEPEPALTPAALSLVNVDDDQIIDLDLDPAVEEQERAWQQVVLEPEPDSVDHVLQALINRARFKQVGVEEVATELVERADLRGEAVSDVLAELVGRADDQVVDPDRASELVLFNDAVPSRPGQLTDFAKLNPADKKRIIIRVLCLLVARSEDQLLPPRVGGETPNASWPLARAAWPSASGDQEGDVALPSRLAKSG
jgi:hypothetical protein